jgi:hypothetical protein
MPQIQPANIHLSVFSGYYADSCNRGTHDDDSKGEKGHKSDLL